MYQNVYQIISSLAHTYHWLNVEWGWDTNYTLSCLCCLYLNDDVYLKWKKKSLMIIKIHFFYVIDLDCSANFHFQKVGQWPTFDIIYLNILNIKKNPLIFFTTIS